MACARFDGNQIWFSLSRSYYIVWSTWSLGYRTVLVHLKGTAFSTTTEIIVEGNTSSESEMGFAVIDRAHTNFT